MSVDQALEIESESNLYAKAARWSGWECIRRKSPAILGLKPLFSANPSSGDFDKSLVIFSASVLDNLATGLDLR